MVFGKARVERSELLDPDPGGRFGPDLMFNLGMREPGSRGVNTNASCTSK
jgi:hypothetical protein